MILLLVILCAAFIIAYAVSPENTTKLIDRLFAAFSGAAYGLIGVGVLLLLYIMAMTMSISY